MAVAQFKVWIHKKTGEAVVKPPLDRASINNGKFQLTNKTTQDIIVKVPALFGTGMAPDPETVTTVKPGNANRLELLVHSTTAEGVYSFPVFCLETFTFAKANSDPEIIIEN